MKKLLLIFFISNFSFINFNSSAQTSVYHPFPDSDAVWNVSMRGPECPNCYQRSYYISGDTTINGFSYRKIDYSHRPGFTTPPLNSCIYPYPYVSIFYLGAIRQDTAQKKVYFVPSGYVNDTLLYNFSMNVGDTIPGGYNNIMPVSIYIVSIDSVLIGTNYRKRFHLGNTVNVSLIEGIGSTTGLIEDICVFECGGMLDCFSQNEITLYPDTSWQCDIINTVQEPEIKNQQSKIALSPNPFFTTTMLEIKNSKTGMKNCELKIYNTMGSCVRTVSLSFGDNRSKANINRDILVDGLYFYELTTSTFELIGSGKFVVE